MVDAITKYKNKTISFTTKEKRLIPDRPYVNQDYGQDALDLIYKFNLDNKPKFKHLIKAFSKIELLEDDNFYKSDLKKFWEHHFNNLLKLYWNDLYKIDENKDKFQDNSIENWRDRLGIKKQLVNPIDIRMNLMNRNGIDNNSNLSYSAFSNTQHDNMEVFESNNLPVEDEEEIVVNQAPDPELLNFINDGKKTKVKKSKEEKKSVEKSVEKSVAKVKKQKVKLSWIEKHKLKNKAKKKAKLKKQAIKQKQKVVIQKQVKKLDNQNLLSNVNLADLNNNESEGIINADFFAKQFNDNILNDNLTKINIEKFNIERKKSVEDYKMNVIDEFNDKSKYSLDFFAEREIDIFDKNDDISKKPVISKKPKSINPNEKERLIDLKEKLLDDLKKELKYKRTMAKLNKKNEKILNKALKKSDKKHMDEVKKRRKWNKETLKKYDNIGSKKEENKLDKMLANKSKLNIKEVRFKDLANKELTLKEQQKMYEIDSKIIDSQKEIALIESKLHKKNK